MSKEQKSPSRRDVMAATGAAVATSVLANVPLVHAGENNLIQIALVGCGSRGTGAAENALLASGGPTRLTAMADVFAGRLGTSHGYLQRTLGRQVDVPEARRFIGFNAYRQAMDSLRAGDVVILATPPAFRWPMFAYAIEKRLHVFMEKPISVDGPSTRRMFALGEQAARANLKVGVGLMCRHCDARKELYQRIRDGQIGDITLMRAYRMHGPIGFFNSPPKPDNMTHLMYQIQRFHSFLWASGGCFSDFYIHNIDECCWMKNAWPVRAQASGGRHFRRIEAGNYRGDSVDQNFDSYSVEYTFGDGTKLFLEGRCIAGCHGQFASYAHGTRAAATISRSGHSPSFCRIFRGQNITNNNDDAAWRFAREEPVPYQLEWNHLMDAIRNNRPFNEVARGAEASLITAMGRYAAHTGQVITRDEMLAHQHEFAPNVDRLTVDSPAPLEWANGRYPVPQPGITTTREY
ncbi:MAG: Gfo/Idh/MocA family oxidoreductase [Planctomycetes bacterium]|nr:Gfo/Idh/MocA family oxidoreductase [Planctomycetota bacterium]